MDDDTESAFERMLEARTPDDELTRRERRGLRQPVTRVRPDNICTWHLSQHTIFEDETDPKLIRRGHYLRPVGTTDGARASEEEIVRHERRLGVRLPEPWREVYKHFNGGWVHTLHWGDKDDPRMNDVEPLPQSSHEFLALPDVAPLRDVMGAVMDGFDWHRLDPRLIAIACADAQALLLDYREGDAPKVCLGFFDRYVDDPVATWEDQRFTYRWPNMRVYFRGLYLQDRIV